MEIEKSKCSAIDSEETGGAEKPDRLSPQEVVKRVNGEAGYEAVTLGSALYRDPTPMDPYIAGAVAMHDAAPKSALGVLTTRLLSIESACRQAGFSRAAFWRFRKRHRIHLLPGRRISLDDIIEAFEAEKRGRRRLAG